VSREERRNPNVLLLAAWRGVPRYFRVYPGTSLKNMMKEQETQRAQKIQSFVLLSSFVRLLIHPLLIELSASSFSFRITIAFSLRVRSEIHFQIIQTLAPSTFMTGKVVSRRDVQLASLGAGYCHHRQRRLFVNGSFTFLCGILKQLEESCSPRSEAEGSYSSMVT